MTSNLGKDDDVQRRDWEQETYKEVEKEEFVVPFVVQQCADDIVKELATARYMSPKWRYDVGIVVKKLYALVDEVKDGMVLRPDIAYHDGLMDGLGIVKRLCDMMNKAGECGVTPNNIEKRFGDLLVWAYGEREK